MKTNLLILLTLLYFSGFSQYKKLTKAEKDVILYKKTEMPFTGKYNNYTKKGVYTCKQCGAKLYKSSSKFSSNCGWPSFDQEIEGAVKRVPDKDGQRTEIICSNCKAHLGHVFIGEHFTSKNTRHCVNSISMDFISSEPKIDTVYFAGGCFWGVEYYFNEMSGVLETNTGYIGGNIVNPDYKLVCSNTTNYAEAVQVIYDNSTTSFETLAKLFFEIHDPTQLNRQGPDIGLQYRSEIFYTKNYQKETSIKLILKLKDNGFDIKTNITKARKFYLAEDYHQNYYKHKGTKPYCHIYTKRF